MGKLTKLQNRNQPNAGKDSQAAAIGVTPGVTEDEPADPAPPKYPVPALRGPRLPVPAGASGGSPAGPGGPRGPLVAGGSGFFHIRKKGQGYWTRMGTAGAAALIGAMTMQFIYSERQTFGMAPGAAYLACAIFALAFGLAVYYFMNRSNSVDFLIATDSELKKVNWTSRAELMGSTKVVILFMFVIAIFLFLTDLFFGYFFYMVGVLKTKPI